MSDDGADFNFALLRVLRSWVDQLMYCKNHQELDPNYKNSTQLIGSFKITHSYSNAKSWNYCGYYTELPEIISHYLRLNLTFIIPNHDFDGTLGWYNETHSSGPNKMISNNQIDYITNEVLVTENIWHPNLYQLSTGLFNNHAINFIVRKQIIKTSISDYFKTFNWLTWLLIFFSISIVSIVQTFISQNKFDKYFCRKLLFDYLNMLLSKSSVLLSKLIPRHYLMYFIPILSFLIINLFQNIIYSNMIVPRKHWCQDINCFAQSKFDFFTTSDDPALIALKKKKDWQFKVILSRLKINSPKCK